MNCPKCHVDKSLLSDDIIAGWDGKDFDVEMENKGIFGYKTVCLDGSDMEPNTAYMDCSVTTKGVCLYQCPICKNIEIN